MQIGRDPRRHVEIRAITCFPIARQALHPEAPPGLVCRVLAGCRQRDARWNRGLVGQAITRYRDPVDVLRITRHRIRPTMPMPGPEIGSKHLVGPSGPCRESVRADGVRGSCLHQRNLTQGPCNSLVTRGSIGSEICADMYLGCTNAPGHLRHNVFRAAVLDKKLATECSESSIHVSQVADEKGARAEGRPAP